MTVGMTVERLTMMTAVQPVMTAMAVCGLMTPGGGAASDGDDADDG